MRERIATRGGDEADALSRRVKRFFNWESGDRKQRKRSYNRRVRLMAKRELRRAAG